MLKTTSKIQISVLNQGSIRPELANYLMQLLTDNRYQLTITYPFYKPIQHSRNLIVREFLKTDREWLIMIDDDIVPHRNILSLIGYDKDIIGLPVPIWKSEIVGDKRKTEIGYMILDWVENESGYRQRKVEGNEGMIEVDAVGTGCIIINRRVLEKLDFPFKRTWNEDGTQNIGLDLMFCKMAKEIGFKVFTHLDYVCSQYENIDILEISKLLGSRD